jgi:amidohydrolase
MSSNKKKTRITVKEDLLRHLRQDVLHKHPEISGGEWETAKRIVGFLKSFQPNKIIEGLGGTGVAAIYQRFEGGPTILIRCELDGLPIKEESNKDYRSRNEGLAHVCGHDGHMAIVAGLAPLLQENRPGHGRIVLLFQPAEENGQGAVSVINDPAFEEIKPDYVFALHNLPGYPLNALVVRHGRFTASVTSMILKYKGKTAHAGEPENGINPAQVIARSVLAVTKYHKNDPDSAEFSVVTPVFMSLGEKAYGVSAGYGELHLTLRCWTMDRLRKLCSVIEDEIRDIAKEDNLELEIEYTQEFQANINDDSAMQVVLNAAKEFELELIERDTAFKWGEDFGQFTQRFRGAMFGLGAGENTPALHNPDYDFPDELIPTGTRLFYQIIQEILDGT